MTAGGIEPRRFYTEAEAAELLHYSTRTLRRWRRDNVGPRATKYGTSISPRHGYFGIDLLKYLQEGRK